MHSFARRTILFWTRCLLLVLAAQPVHSCAATLYVFAAASLTDSLKEIGAAHEAKTGDKIRFNFGASSFLARQIEEGAPADLFFSADAEKMDRLEKQGLLLDGTRKNRLSNALVIVAYRDSTLVIKSASDLTNAQLKRLALADTRTVPAGLYAKEYLAKLKLWEVLRPKIVPTDNVRAALAAVESGNVEAGIVYKTDAVISPRVKIVYEIPAREQPSIRYPMAVLREAKEAEAAKRFLKYLESEEAGQVFERHGFIVLK